MRADKNYRFISGVQDGLVLGGLSAIYTLKKFTEIALTHANLKMMKIAITLMMIIQIITKVSFQMHFCWLGTFFV